MTAPLVKWVDNLPKFAPRGGRTSMYEPALNELKKNPGKWAELPTAKPTSTASWLNGHREGFEARLRTVDGVLRLYVRWTEVSS